MKSLKLGEADRCFRTITVALACISMILGAAAASRAGGYHVGARPRANHRYAIQPNQYGGARPSPHTPPYGFFPTHWRRWPGLWAVSDVNGPTRAEPEEIEPRPADLPTEALPLPGQPGEQLGPIMLPTPGEVEVEEGPPRPPVELTPETPESGEEGVAPPPLEEPDFQPLPEQPETEPTPMPESPSEPELPPELRETLPPPQEPQGEPLPTPDDFEEMPPQEPGALLGRADGLKLSSPTVASGWTARFAVPRRGGAAGRSERPVPASYRLPHDSSSQTTAPNATSYSIGEQPRRDRRQDIELRFPSPDGRTGKSMQDSRASDSRKSTGRMPPRPTQGSAANPLRGGVRTPIERRPAPTELLFRNPLRDGSRKE